MVADAGLIVMVGVGLTVTLTFTESLQPPVVVPTTLYVIVLVGLTTLTDAPVVELRNIAGLHLYVIPEGPVAIKVPELPAQTMGADGETVNVGFVTVTVSKL